MHAKYYHADSGDTEIEKHKSWSQNWQGRELEFANRSQHVPTHYTDYLQGDFVFSLSHTADHCHPYHQTTLSAYCSSTEHGETAL